MDSYCERNSKRAGKLNPCADTSVPEEKNKKDSVSFVPDPAVTAAGYCQSEAGSD